MTSRATARGQQRHLLSPSLTWEGELFAHWIKVISLTELPGLVLPEIRSVIRTARAHRCGIGPNPGPGP